jgi:signal transduction histidine kinase
MALPPQLRRFLPLLLVFSSGTILCSLAFLGARRMEEKSIRAEFILGSENRISALRREIDTNLAALAALCAFTEVFPQQTKNDFEHFAARTVAVYPEIRALEWSPRVPDSERKAFEEQMRRDELLLTTPLSSEQRDYAVTVQHSGEALLTIINDVLDFSKIEAGKLHFEEIEFNLTEVVKRILGLLSEQAAVKDLLLTSSIAPNVPRCVRGDPTRLGQVLTNLLGNAIKFTESGKVSLSVTALEQTSVDVKLRFEVNDTGIGISPDACHVIFESFAQADGSMTRKYGGTGLGLAISKQIVENMQGEIGVDSEPGAGSPTRNPLKQPGLRPTAAPQPTREETRTFVQSHPRC